MLGQLVGEQVFYQVLLHLAEGHDAYRGLLGQAAQRLLYDGLGLGAVAACAPVVVDAVHGYEGDARRAVVGRWEGEQAPVVVLCVAEGDEALVPRAVVP